MTWQQLVDVLERCVPTGSVTTYAEVSLWGYGVPDMNQPVRSLLRGARNHDYQRLTNRVVKVNGELADLPEGPDQQRQQLLIEGVPLAADGRVDFDQISPVELA
jgi:alkylated DNA nucleotide flippase Atl1